MIGRASNGTRATLKPFMNLLAIYEKLEAVLKRLPEGFHQPILREIEPIKTLFLQQRPRESFCWETAMSAARRL
jgi:hypothetical protein